MHNTQAFRHSGTPVDKEGRGVSHMHDKNKGQHVSCKTRGQPEFTKGSLSPGSHLIVQELCESRGGRPGQSVLTSLLVSVDVKIY